MGALTVVEDAQLPARAGIDVGGGVTATLPEVMQIAELLAGAATLPQAYRKPADVMAAALTAAQLRLPLMTVINGTHMINGKVTLSADLMAGVARGSGEVESWQEEEIQRGYRVSATRKGGTSLTVTFTLDDAKAAGLTGGNWSKFPTDMCRARAISRLCRRLFPDILAGMYSPDEMEDARAEAPARMVDVETGEVLEAEFEQPAPVKTDKKTRDFIRALMGNVEKATCADEIQKRRKELHTAITDARSDGKLSKQSTTYADAMACLDAGLERQRAMREAEAEQPQAAQSDPSPFGHDADDDQEV